jgi:hypothetical protein
MCTDNLESLLDFHGQRLGRILKHIYRPDMFHMIDKVLRL